MKKSLIALAVLASIAGGASAQSSVTAFGVVDVAYRYIDNSGTKVHTVGNDGLLSSRLGFRGVEDLGGGLKAGFWLESGVNPDTGGINANGKFWHRRSTVSLEGGFGEARLGRDFTPTYTAVSNFDPYGDTGPGGYSKLISTLGGTLTTQGRADNLVQYFLPKNLGGFYGGVAGAYGTTEATAAGDDYKLAVASVAYNFGFLKLVGSYSKSKLLSTEEDLILLGATAPVGNGLIRASVARADLSGGTVVGRRDADDATLIAVGYVHNLSKRTAVYTTYAQISNKAGQTIAVAATTPSVAAGGKSRSFDLGIRHSF
jgi:predicted porin